MEAELSVHIFSVSAALVGVCLTVIGLYQVVLRLKDWNSPVDNILAGNAALFLFACMLAYASIRSRSPRRRRSLERIADVCFLFALVIMTVICAVIPFELL